MDACPDVFPIGVVKIFACLPSSPEGYAGQVILNKIEHFSKVSIYRRIRGAGRKKTLSDISN